MAGGGLSRTNGAQIFLGARGDAQGFVVQRATCACMTETAAVANFVRRRGRGEEGASTVLRFPRRFDVGAAGEIEQESGHTRGQPRKTTPRSSPFCFHSLENARLSSHNPKNKTQKNEPQQNTKCKNRHTHTHDKQKTAVCKLPRNNSHSQGSEPATGLSALCACQLTPETASRC